MSSETTNQSPSTLAEVDPHMLSLLSPEEIEAIRDGEAAEASEADVAALKEIAGEDQAAKTPPDDKAAADQAAAAATDEAKAAPAAAAPAQESTPADKPAPQTGYKFELPADHAEKVEDLRQRAEALKAKFKTGEMEVDAYEAQREALASERAVLDRAELKAEISSESRAQATEQDWAHSVRSFVNSTAKVAPDQGGIDYFKDNSKRGDLDAFVKALANDDANADKPHDWFLQEAHKRVLALHGLTVAKPVVPDNTKPSARTQGAIKDLPKSLHDVPGGSAHTDTAGEFADIDALDGEDFEAALARMTPAARQKYLAAA